MRGQSQKRFDQMAHVGALAKRRRRGQRFKAFGHPASLPFIDTLHQGPADAQVFGNSLQQLAIVDRPALPVADLSSDGGAISASFAAKGNGKGGWDGFGTGLMLQL